MLAASSQEPPLKVVRAFRLEDGSALVHLHNVSGGLLGGDELAMSLEIGENAQAQVTTTGATRIYRSRADAAPAIQRIHVHVGQNACLEYLPDPIIPFAGSRFTQDTKIQLDASSGLFWWEVLAPGREARDELFAYDAVEMKTSICALDSPIAIERVRVTAPPLSPQLRPLDSENIDTGPLFTFAASAWSRTNGSLSNSNSEKSRANFLRQPTRFGASAPCLPMALSADAWLYTDATLSPALTNSGAPRNLRYTAPKRFHREK